MLFQCNICGSDSKLEAAHLYDPELPSCGNCLSNVRHRWLVYALSSELFGAACPLYDFPESKHLRGLGLSDPLHLAAQFARVFTYTNTFFGSPPHFDIRQDAAPDGEPLDFLISSEVFEHVEGNVARAFLNTARLLRPEGVLLLTVPWVWSGHASDALPDLNDWALSRDGTGWQIVNHDADGRVEVFTGLSLNGAPGPCPGRTREHFSHLNEWEVTQEGDRHVLSNTLRRCDCSQGSTGRGASEGGVFNICFANEERTDMGIVFPYPWSQPLIVRR